MRSYKCLTQQAFQNKQYEIVPIRDEDKFLIMKWRNEQIYHLRQNEPLTEESQKQYFSSVIKDLFNQANPSQILFSYLEEGTCIGYGGLVHINWAERSAEISFIINTELERQYFELHWINFLSLIEQVAFTELNFQRIFTYAYDLRPHLYQALEKSGFKLESVLKAEHLWDDKYVDVVIHSKLKKTKLDVCLLVSGQLGYTVLKKLYSEENIVAVLTNKNSQEIIDFTKLKSLPLFIGNPREGKAFNFVKKISFDILLSVNYLYVIEEDLISLPKKFAINVHGSLLPKYRGRTPHVWAIINGERETGVTAHIINAGVDTGDIIAQKSIIIREEDTGASILEQYNQLYPELLQEVLNGVKSNSLILKKQDDNLSSYFPKRTPEDGEINWNLPREQIRDWIRAQSKPYPGAFSWYNGEKVYIHKASLNGPKIINNESNGEILSILLETLLISTSTGLLELSDIENFQSFNFKANTYLGS